MPSGHFDLTAPEFLALYIVLLIVAAIAGLILPRWLGVAGRDTPLDDPDQLALLSGGTTRFVDTVVARLLQSGALAMTDSKHFAVAPTGAPRGPADRAVLALPSPAAWPAVERTIAPHAGAIDRQLVDRGLLMGDASVRQMRWWQTLPYVTLLGFGAVRWELGRLRDHPVGFLTALMVLTAVLALIRWIAVDRLTRGGRAALARARDNASRLKRAPLPAETGLAVALFGTTVLIGSGWSDFHTLRSQSGDTGWSGGDAGSSGDGGSSGCGGGGCGGGGCGG